MIELLLSPRLRSLFLLSLGAFVLASCAGDAEKYGRSYVSSMVEQRAVLGIGIGPGSAPGTVTVPEGVTIEPRRGDTPGFGGHS